MAKVNVNTKTVVQGPSFLGLLTLVFITLKLIGVIDWAWWQVLLPLWGPLALVIGIGIIGLLLWSLYILCKKFNKRKR